VPTTTRDKLRRLRAEQASIATAVEAAIAAGKLEQAVQLGPRWDAIRDELERDEIERAEYRDLPRDIRSEDLGDNGP